MSRKDEGLRIKGWHIAVVIIGIAILLGYVVVDVKLPGGQEPTVIYTAPDGVQFQNYNEYLAYMYANFPGQAPEPIAPPVSETHPASQVQFTTNDFITKGAVTTATTTADFCKADQNGIFNFMSQADTLTVGTTPDTSNVYFGDGDQVVVRIDCTGDPTGGLDYYDGWYYFVLHEGNPVYFLTVNMLQQASVKPYTYRVSATGAETTGYIVTWTSGTTNYWDIGQLYLYPRSSAANFDTYFTYQSSTLASVTDGSTWVNTDALITANATLASTDENLYFEVYAGATNVGWGWSNLVVTREGEVQEYKAVIIVSTNMTAIGVTELLNAGWKSINDNTLTSEKAFYYMVDAEREGTYTSKGSKMDFKVRIPVDSSAAASSSGFMFKIWAIDMQLEANVAIGSVSTTVPTAYGFVTAYGPGAMIQASAYSTSSGAATGRILQSVCTTP